MRLIVICFWHGKTSSDRQARRETGTTNSRHFNLDRISATVAGDSTTGLIRGYSRANRHCPWSGPCDRGSTSMRLPQEKAGRASTLWELGRTSAGPAHPKGGMRFLKTLAGESYRRPSRGRLTRSSRPGAKTWATRQGVSGLSTFGPAWVAKGGTGHTASQEQTRGSRGLEKKLPEVLETLLDRKVVKKRRVRLIFQDEARFGRMVRIRRCWAPAPQRPVVDNGYEREFQYVYGAVSPIEGDLDWMICPAMNTEQMSKFLAQVSAAHARDFIIMVVDGASSHVAKDLVIPENIRLHRLPGYSPELNPQEHLWDEIREKEFPNRVFSDMAGVVRTLKTGLPRLASDRDRLRSICAWPWIVSLNLTAN